jgi:hypothetical protein
MTSKPWWLTDIYDGDAPVPVPFVDLAGPRGVALVKAWPSGQTDPGWGLMPPKNSTEGFMPRYERGEFLDRRAIHGYERGKWAFAFIMRSVQIVAIDIDGKNGGFDHAKRLGKMPTTLAETSKSGNGYHLFYLHEEPWHPLTGFGQLADRIGIEQGVDIRATGCVYHHDTQRWNSRDIAPLPAHLKDSLLHREQKITSTAARIDKILADQDDMEVLMLHDEILTDLAKPIPAGKRNVTLFALGNQMRQANIPDWQDKLLARGDELGLPDLEMRKLVTNIEHYGSPVVP